MTSSWQEVVTFPNFSSWMMMSSSDHLISVLWMCTHVILGSLTRRAEAVMWSGRCESCHSPCQGPCPQWCRWWPPSCQPARIQWGTPLVSRDPCRQGPWSPGGRVAGMKKYEALSKAPKDVDVLKWWYSHSAELPIMYKIALYYLGVPVSSSGSERTFSTSGRIDTLQRRRITPKHIEQLTVLKENWRVVESIKKTYSIQESN